MSEQTVIINIPPVEEWTITILRYACKNHKVKGYTKMDREQLIQHVKEILGHKKN